MAKLPFGRRFMKRLTIAFSLVLLILCPGCIDFTQEHSKQDYGQLCTAVMVSADKTDGYYKGKIPKDLDSTKFLKILKGRIPGKDYEQLDSYPLILLPKTSYYLLKIYSKTNQQMILFDYSCTPEIDGPLLDHPGKYDINNLSQYDKCQEK